MKTHSHEIQILYDATSPRARRTIAYAHTLSNHVKEWEYHKDPLTTTMWKQLLSKLNLDAKQLLDKSHSFYQENVRGRTFDDEGWLNVIRRNTFLIKAPIVIKGDKAILCTNPTQLFSLLKNQVSVD